MSVLNIFLSTLHFLCTWRKQTSNPFLNRTLLFIYFFFLEIVEYLQCGIYQAFLIELFKHNGLHSEYVILEYIIRSFLKCPTTTLCIYLDGDISSEIYLVETVSSTKQFYIEKQNESRWLTETQKSWVL